MIYKFRSVHIVYRDRGTINIFLDGDQVLRYTLKNRSLSWELAFTPYYERKDYLMYIFRMFLYVIQISVVHSIKPLYSVHNWWLIHLSASNGNQKKRNTCLKLWFYGSFFYNIALIWSDSWFKILKTAISGYRDKGVWKLDFGVSVQFFFFS